MIFKIKWELIVASIVMLFASAEVMATSSEGGNRASSGSVVCSGNYNSANNIRARWIIHNISARRSITLDRMRIFSADATVVYDSDISGPAPSQTVVAFGVIQPNQTVMFRSEQLIASGLLPASLPGNQRPIKVLFNWTSTSGRRVLTPYVLLSRPGPGDARHARDCRAI